LVRSAWITFHQYVCVSVAALLPQVCECVVILRGLKEVSWGGAKAMMADPSFLRTLVEFDKDSLSEKQVRQQEEGLKRSTCLLKKGTFGSGSATLIASSSLFVPPLHCACATACPAREEVCASQRQTEKHIFKR
jgi:hypothetical protein